MFINSRQQGAIKNPLCQPFGVRNIRLMITAVVMINVDKLENGELAERTQVHERKELHEANWKVHVE